MRKINLKEGEQKDDTTELDEIQLAGADQNDEETKETASDSQDEKKEENKKAPPFKRPLNRESVQAYSRWLHRNTPENHYFKVKIPWKTILIAFVFFIVGTILLYIGFSEMVVNGNTSEVWEKIILGLILFIPGSFHTVLAF